MAGGIRPGLAGSAQELVGITDIDPDRSPTWNRNGSMFTTSSRSIHSLSHSTDKTAREASPAISCS